MKKIIASVGLVALGATSMNAAYAPGLTRHESAKPWSISASLRGFYDDNYATRPSGPAKRDSFGFEVSPSASINLPLDQTFIGASYVYSMRYYEDRNSNRADHSHNFNAKLDHAFSENYKIELNNSLLIAHEPDLDITSGGITVPVRQELSYLRNRASANFHGRLTHQLGFRAGYQNTLYDYDDPVYTFLLDRMEHLPSLDLRWQFLPQTVGVLGYQYEQVDYDRATFKDNRSHFVYVGADQSFANQVNASVRVGAQYKEFHRQNRDDWNPYADASLSYGYAPGSYIQAGINHRRIPVDTLSANDQEATRVYASITHQIFPNLTGSLLGHAQHAELQDGPLDGQDEQIYLVGLNLNYRFNQFLSAETGYNYDRLRSDLGRGYSRNRVYVGVRATF